MFPRLVLTACALALALAGCAVGPDFTRPETAAPDDWNSWRSADDALRAPLAATPALPSQWWLAFGDPVLNQLQQRAVAASPDLRTAALRYAQARSSAASSPRSARRRSTPAAASRASGRASTAPAPA